MILKSMPLLISIHLDAQCDGNPVLGLRIRHVLPVFAQKAQQSKTAIGQDHVAEAARVLQYGKKSLNSQVGLKTSQS